MTESRVDFRAAIVTGMNPHMRLGKNGQLRSQEEKCFSKILIGKWCELSMFGMKLMYIILPMIPC